MASTSIIYEIVAKDNGASGTFRRVGDAADDTSKKFSSMSAAQALAGDAGERFAKKIDKVNDSLAPVRTSMVNVARAAGDLSVLGSVASVAVSAGTALERASGAAGLLPAAFTAAGVAAVTVKLGLDGIKTAFGELSPQANALKASVDLAFTRGLQPAVNDLRRTIPQLSAGLSGVATAESHVVNGFAKWAATPAVISAVNVILRGTSTIVEHVGAAIPFIADAFVRVAAVGIPILSQLTSGIGGAAQRFDQWVQRMADSGKMTQWIQVGIQQFHQWFQEIATLGSVAVSIFTAFQQAGVASGNAVSEAMGLIGLKMGGLPGLIIGLVLPAFAQLANTPAGHAMLVQLAGDMAQVSSVVTNVLSAALNAVMPLLPPLLDAFAKLAQQVLPLLIGAINFLAPVLLTVANFISKNIGWLGPLAIALGIATAAVWALNIALEANPFVLIGTLIIALVAIIYTYWTPIKGFFLGIFNAIADAALWLWHNVFEVVWNGIATAVSWVWNTIIKPIFDSYVIFFTQYIPAAALWLWHNVFEPVWNGIGAAVSFVYNAVLVPVWNALVGAWNWIAGVANWLWHNVIEPVWDGIGGAISWAWNNVISPVFNAITGGIQWVGHVFEDVKNGAIQVFKDLANFAFVDPFNWVINIVVNEGINWILSHIGDVIGQHWGVHVDPIPRLATGGVIPGYTPGVDNQLIAVGGGEAIMRPEWTRMVGASYVYAANAAARQGKFLAPGFADGGIAPNMNPAVGTTLDIGAFAKVFGLSSAIAGLNAAGAFAKLFSGDVLGAFKQFFGGDSTNWGALLVSLGAALNDVVYPLTAKLDNGTFGHLANGVVHKVGDGVYNFLADHIRAAQNASTGIGAVPPASGDAAAAQAFAAAHLAQFGWGQDQMPALIRLWNKESGWNANAVNPSSGAYGIPQALGHGHPYNLGDYANQVMWGLNYIKGRYGSPAAAWAHEQAFNWYGNGLVGGIFNRPTLIGVGERGPERVDVTPLRGGNRGASNTPQIVQHNTFVINGDASANDIMSEAMFAMRKIRRGGVYA